MVIRRIAGRSMEPHFYDGDIVVFRHRKLYATQDVVMAIIENKEVIKRINQMHGGNAYLLGDNPDQSTDSRKYGFISATQIKGRVILRIPVSKFIAKQR